MREIKFRGKFKDEWHYGNLINCNNGDIRIEDYPKESGWLAFGSTVYPETVGQYTGLKDKNGVEIYEGDIVKVNCPYSFKLEVGTICYNDGCFDIIGNTGGRDYLKCHTANHAVKVIGNIYDNPELLEGTTK